jgi:hypothetical protein
VDGGRCPASGDRVRRKRVQQHPSPPQQPQTITDKGTPFGDLLMPKLTSSVADGDVGVTVDAPVTVSAEDGVLGAVTMTDEDGATVAGRLGPDGLRWTTTDPLGYNQRYTLNAQSLGLAGVTNRSAIVKSVGAHRLTGSQVPPSTWRSTPMGSTSATGCSVRKT